MSSIHWPRAVAYGVIWGISVTAINTFQLPLGSMSANDLLRFLANLLPHSCAAGVVLAAAVMLMATRPIGPLEAAGALAAFSLVQLFFDWFFRQVIHVPFWATWNELSILSGIWDKTLYAGLFMAGYRLSIKAESTRRLLSQAEIARLQAQARLSDAQFQALQGQVDPAFLLRVLQEVESRYEDDAAGADQLLDRLVGFLRAAMPGIRSGSSCLAAEAELSTQYSRVMGELDGKGPALRLSISGAIPDLPFPPLLMLPVLEQLACSAEGAQVDMLVEQRDAQCRLSLHCSGLRKPEWLGPELLYRLQVGLRALFDRDWALTLSLDPRLPAFALTLPLRAAASISPTNQNEVSYG